MTLSVPAGYIAGDLLFRDEFAWKLQPPWHPYLASRGSNGGLWNTDGAGGSGMGNTNNAEYDVACGRVDCYSNHLNLSAIRQSIVGKVNGSNFTFPFTGGAVCTYGSFEFTGGYVQISMKAPAGKGSWPGLWLLPGHSAPAAEGDDFEIDMQEGGFTKGGVPENQAFAWHLKTPGEIWFGGVVDIGIDLTAAFHTYAIDWVSGQSITWFLDGVQMGQLTSAQAPIPAKPMQLLMDISVANANTASWHSVYDATTPGIMQMIVDVLEVYQHR